MVAVKIVRAKQPPIRVLSANMILRGIATPTRLGCENARDLPEQGDAQKETAHFPLTWSPSFSFS
jgi:hypothetical protein